MIELFREKLKAEGRSLKWFWENRLPKDLRYIYFVQQLGNFKKLSDEVKEAIQIYLNSDDK
jgi:hypothetical protein